MKSYYTTSAKNIEVPNQLGAKRKGIVSQPTSEETTYFTFSEMQISPLSNYFKLFKKSQITSWSIASPRKKNYLGSSLFSFYQGMVRSMKMCFYGNIY